MQTLMRSLFQLLTQWKSTICFEFWFPIKCMEFSLVLQVQERLFTYQDTLNHYPKINTWQFFSAWLQRHTKIKFKISFRKSLKERGEDHMDQLLEHKEQYSLMIWTCLKLKSMVLSLLLSWYDNSLIMEVGTITKRKKSSS